MMGCNLSGSRRVRPVIDGCLTAPPAQTIAVLTDGRCNIESAVVSAARALNVISSEPMWLKWSHAISSRYTQARLYAL